MKNWIVLIGVFLLLGVIGVYFLFEKGSQGDRINGLTPAEAVLKYEKAMLEKDDSVVKAFATQNELERATVYFKLSNKTLDLPTTFPFKEYMVNEDLFYYYVYTTVKHYYEVTRTKDGWKIEYIPMDKFEKIIEGLKPNNLQGVYQGDEI